MTTSYIADKDGNSIETSKATSKPSDRHFRNAWSLSGTVISEDMTAAKVIFKDKIRQVRKPLLEAQDVLYMKAIEDGDSSAQSTVATKKKELRDAPAASAITNADTITKLKAAWNTSLLGTSPYA
tara:strand:+ start:49 stop:423 length:375 start_codon:yes stop_codon:yes gene_type:complete